jgi:hypothetical protein
MAISPKNWPRPSVDSTTLRSPRVIEISTEPSLITYMNGLPIDPSEKITSPGDAVRTGSDCCCAIKRSLDSGRPRFVVAKMKWPICRSIQDKPKALSSILWKLREFCGKYEARQGDTIRLS